VDAGAVEELPESLHVNAMGADAPNKREWPSSLLSACEVVVDDIEQAAHSGEISRALEEGTLQIEDLGGTLGQRLIEPEADPSPRTLFDSTGLAVQDTAAARVLLEADTPPDARFPFLSQET